MRFLWARLLILETLVFLFLRNKKPREPIEQIFEIFNAYAYSH
ncbi:hypothetical protein TSAR_003239, partial [Trichomalopsis sarcophagae]